MNINKKIAAGIGLLATALGVYLWTKKAEAAQIQLEDLTISPEAVNPGQDVTVSVTAVNNSGESLARTINLGGDFMAQKTITLGPGESQVVAFTVTPSAAATYHVSVDGLTGSFICTEAPVADIQLSDLVISPTSCYVGDEVTISVTATNYGNASGSRTITATVS